MATSVSGWRIRSDSERELRAKIATVRSLLTTRVEELANGKNEQAERLALMHALFSLHFTELYISKLHRRH
jgi:hypothetical protein